MRQSSSFRICIFIHCYIVTSRVILISSANIRQDDKKVAQSYLTLTMSLYLLYLQQYHIWNINYFTSWPIKSYIHNKLSFYMLSTDANSNWSTKLHNSLSMHNFSFALHWSQIMFTRKPWQIWHNLGNLVAYLTSMGLLIAIVVFQKVWQSSHFIHWWRLLDLQVLRYAK